MLKADQEFDGLYNELLLEMARNQIFLINERQLSVNQQSWLRNYFKLYLRQHITPILINRETDLGHPGLKQAKMSYHPIELVDYYSLMFCNG